jgi:4-hydroxybenzoate polyprenyltransferase
VTGVLGCYTRSIKQPSNITARRTNGETPAPASGDTLFLDYWRALRPRHWIRNTLVFVPLISSGRFLEPAVWVRSGIVLAAFSLLSSCVYLFNDVADRDRDRIHPRKRLRPIAAGRIGAQAATALAVALAAAAFLLAWQLHSLAVLAVLAAYACCNLAYSFGAKQMVITDVFLVASGFLLRVLAGAYAIAVIVSPWLFVVTLFLSLAISLIKRRAEVASMSGEAAQHREVLGQYSILLLDQLISISTAAGVFSYALYTFHSPHSNYLMLTLPFFIYANFRYLYLAYQMGMGESPEEIFLRDRPFQINLIFYAASVLAILIWFG